MSDSPYQKPEIIDSFKAADVLGETPRRSTEVGVGQGSKIILAPLNVVGQGSKTTTLQEHKVIGQGSKVTNLHANIGQGSKVFAAHKVIGQGSVILKTAQLIGQGSKLTD